MLKFAENPTKKARSLKAGQKVCRKYRRAHRRKLQRREYERLRAVLPMLAGTAPGEVDEVDVVEEAINYIDYLHAEITRRMCNGEFSLLFALG